jgi:hypothetical protein
VWLTEPNGIAVRLGQVDATGWFGARSTASGSLSSLIVEYQTHPVTT